MTLKTGAIALSFAVLAAAPFPVLAEDTMSDMQADTATSQAGPTVTLGDLSISGAFTRASLPSARAGGAFVNITNTGEAPDRLVGAAADFAEHVELHQMVFKDKVMVMSPVEGGLPIAPGETLSLAPGGYHVMLIGLKRPLKEGTEVPITLKFEKAGEISVPFAVGGIAAQSMPATTGK